MTLILEFYNSLRHAVVIAIDPSYFAKTAFSVITILAHAFLQLVRSESRLKPEELTLAISRWAVRLLIQTSILMYNSL